MMLFVKIGYTKNLTAAKKSTKYIAFRSREGGLGAFDRDKEHADVKEFNRNLSDKMTSYSSSPKVYKVVISLSGDEYKKSGLEYREFIRNAMSSYETCFGRKLTWIASEHMNCSHPHVHILIKPTYEDRHGISYKLKLSNYEFTQFKNIFLHSYDTSINYSRQYTKFLEKERLSAFGKQLTKGVARTIIRQNPFLNSLYKIHSIKKLKTERENIKKFREYKRWIKTETFGSGNYRDFGKIIKQSGCSPVRIELDYKDRRKIASYLNGKDLKWHAIENNTGTKVAIYPFDKSGSIIKPEQIRQYSNTLSRALRSR